MDGDGEEISATVDRHLHWHFFDNGEKISATVTVSAYSKVANVKTPTTPLLPLSVMKLHVLYLITLDPYAHQSLPNFMGAK